MYFNLLACTHCGKVQETNQCDISQARTEMPSPESEVYPTDKSVSR